MILKDYPSAPLRSNSRAGGFRVWVDEGEMRVGDSLIERIATAIKDSGGTRRRRPSMGRCPSAKEGHPRKAAVLSGGEERERVPSGPPHLAAIQDSRVKAWTPTNISVGGQGSISVDLTSSTLHNAAPVPCRVTRL